MHQVNYNVEKGQDSMNRDIPDMYKFSQGNGDKKRKLYSHHESNESSHGKKITNKIIFLENNERESMM